MNRIWPVIVCSAAMLLGAETFAAAQTTQPASSVPATQPMAATVDSVTGSVQARPAAGGKFAPVNKGDTLAPGTLITTGPRSQAVVTFGDNSVVVVEQLSAMTIDEVYRQARGDTPTVVTRLKLRNGSLRAGVERGRTQSDFQVSTPVATLSVRGTRPIRAYYDAGAGQLWFFLAREGRLTGAVAGGGRTVDVLPGQGTNQSLTLPVLMAIFDWHVQMGDPYGQTLQEFFVEVTNPNAIGGFGGGNPQTIGPMTHGGADTSPCQPDNSADDDYYGDDTGSLTGPKLKKKN